MKNGRLILEKEEFLIIQDLLKNIIDSPNLMNQCITKLKEEMKTALIVDHSHFPDDVVRLNSIIDIDTPFGLMKAQLVLPEHSNSSQKRISLLTPMGSALLGYAEGDELMWPFPTGEKLIRIVKVNKG